MGSFHSLFQMSAQKKEILNWLKENDYPTDIPFGPDVLLTGSVMYYLFMEDERSQKRKSTWTPNNLDLACTEAGYEKFEAFLGKHYSRMGVRYFENESKDRSAFTQDVQRVRFTTDKDSLTFNVFYSTKLTPVEIIESFEFEVTKLKYFDGTNVVTISRDPTATYKPNFHPGGYWDFSTCKCKEQVLCVSCQEQLQKFVKYARRGVTSSVRFDAEDF
jgi:hypothetical protein